MSQQPILSPEDQFLTRGDRMSSLRASGQLRRMGTYSELMKSRRASLAENSVDPVLEEEDDNDPFGHGNNADGPAQNDNVAAPLGRPAGMTDSMVERTEERRRREAGHTGIVEPDGPIEEENLKKLHN